MSDVTDLDQFCWLRFTCSQTWEFSGTQAAVLIYQNKLKSHHCLMRQRERKGNKDKYTTEKKNQNPTSVFVFNTIGKHTDLTCSFFIVHSHIYLHTFA